VKGKKNRTKPQPENKLGREKRCIGPGLGDTPKKCVDRGKFLAKAGNQVRCRACAEYRMSLQSQMQHEAKSKGGSSTVGYAKMILGSPRDQYRESSVEELDVDASEYGIEISSGKVGQGAGG